MLLLFILLFIFFLRII